MAKMDPIFDIRTMLPKYEYQPLENPNDIRILTLLQWSEHQRKPFHDPVFDNAICVNIEHMVRAETIGLECESEDGNKEKVMRVQHVGLEYEAVSYAWGRDNTVEPVFILTAGTFQYLEIRKNVAQMLRYLHLSADKRRLWIDAICINQTDLEEKAVQVARMGQIYSEAAQVLIWIPPPDNRIFGLSGPIHEALDAIDSSKRRLKRLA